MRITFKMPAAVPKKKNIIIKQNNNKIINILSENNYSPEDCIIILRTFLSKAKRILKLAIDLEKNKDINKTINSAKPPIFWKDKEIVKVQLNKWKTKKIKSWIKPPLANMFTR